MKTIYKENNYTEYGLYKTKENVIKLICLSPKFAFESLIKKNPYKFIFTSGTLKDPDKFSKNTGLKL